MKRLIKYFAALVLLLAGAEILTVAQTRMVRGRVSGSDGEILAGATVLNNASGAWAVADNDGRYEIQASGGQQLTFASFGYDDVTISVADASVYDVILPAAASMMLEETVVIGYGKTTKKEITGSVASLKAEDLDVGAFTNAGGMLQGKVAGLSVVNPDGGDPEASFQFLLRGTNTLSAGQGPLIIIDGVLDADIRSINFQEVESIDVLKDGSAAAIYGTRGTNGVVIITTKRARTGNTAVQYDGQISVQTVQARATPMTARAIVEYSAFSG